MISSPDTRLVDKVFNNAIAVCAFIVGSFHLLNVGGIIVLSTRDIRIFHLTMMLVLLFLLKPTLKSLTDSPVDKYVRLGLIVLSIGSSVYIQSRWKDIAMSGGDTGPMDAWVGLLLVVLVLEAARRGVGLALAFICLAFFTYPFYSDMLPGVLNSRGYSVERIAELMTTTSQGIYGIPLGVSSTFIILFSIYGAFLSAFGAGEFFFKLATRLTMGMRAAGAKTAVIFSTLLGMISGSAAGNVAVTGSLTIPMMKKEGYKPHEAGAVEAVVSTGGQMMPPVMGAAAFIMAEIVGVPYTKIMQVGLIPALLFFASIFFVVHLRAVKSGIEGSVQAPDNDEPMWKLLLHGGQYIIPFFTLIVMMVYGYSPFKASFYSILILLAAHIIWTRKLSLDILRKSATAIIDGSKAVVPIAVACAAAGIIAGILGVTGFGSKIASLIFIASGGITFFALLFTMFTAIILGMGLPTTAAYLILATVVAPALSHLGVSLLTAHMFVFFYGCVSTITPPVALAAYVAGGIAGADINKVGWTAFTYGLTCYILPFMFFYGPELLMDGSVLGIAIAFISGMAGAFCIASFVIGQLIRPLAVWQRVLMAAAGLSLLLPGIPTDLLGAAILVGLYLLQRPSRNAVLA